jgi:hypothetical protein
MSDWLKKANDVLGGLADQAGREAKVVQLQAKLGSLDSDLDDVYAEAGRRAEELLRARQIHDDQLRVIVERARTIKEEMMELRQQVQDLRQKPEPSEEEAGPAPGDEAPQPRTCDGCGEEAGEDAAFCAKCGEKLPEQPEETQEDQPEAETQPPPPRPTED